MLREVLTDPELLGCLLVYGIIIAGAWIISKTNKED
jgi:hypothetical protein